MRNSLRFLTSADLVTVVFLLLLSALECVFASRVPGWTQLVAQNLGIAALIAGLALTVHRRGTSAPAAVRFARDLYLVPIILYIYTQASSIAFPLHGRDYDQALIAADRFLFGGDPTVWAFRFAHPALTELLQLAYSSYYLFFIALIAEFSRRPDRRAFETGAFLIVYGFYLSYVGYLLVPAVGPRFTLHDFAATDAELPGLLLTPYLRDIINAGGGAPAGSADPLAAVHRDAFPSGHTQLTLTAMYIAFRMRSLHRWWLLAVGSLLIVSTIYMRYHYGIDVLAGVLFFIAAVASGTALDRWWRRASGR